MSESLPNWDDGAKVLSEWVLENQRLKNENDALVARVARFEEAAQMAILRNPYCDRLEEVLNETPQQSLAEIEAAAVEKLKPDAEMKAVMIGKHTVDIEIECVECAADGDPDDDCDMCFGAGSYTRHITVPWTMQKEIWQQMNKIAAARLRQQGGE